MTFSLRRRHIARARANTAIRRREGETVQERWPLRVAILSRGERLHHKATARAETRPPPNGHAQDTPARVAPTLAPHPPQHGARLSKRLCSALAERTAMQTPCRDQ